MNHLSPAQLVIVLLLAAVLGGVIGVLVARIVRWISLYHGNARDDA